MLTVTLGDCEEALACVKDEYAFVIADPPYSRAGAAHTSRSNMSGSMSGLQASDEFWCHWFSDKWRAIARACQDSACALVFTDYRTIGALERAVSASGSGWELTQAAIWDRGSIGLGSPMRAQHEMIAFVRGPSFKWEGRKDIANVFRCDWPYGKHPHHPAEKPVELLSRLVRLFLTGGGRVLDPFCGSGSSGVACKSLGVPWHGIESDALIAKVAAERLGLRIRMFADTVLRRDGHRLYLMNRRGRGWGERAVEVASVSDCELRFAVTVGAWSEDEHGPYAVVTRDPMPSANEASLWPHFDEATA